ncbi:hypothetical protein Xen7305DRAFT_00007290 [Xenococcus sp. PCC 7305]|uniref:hypothetical protein n=1 Tax=Xenococcus sp. PCC 7305 TaxID=102125 RepID=UPI0002AC00E6|nr:hypothetical protein [Xenococcus sp. PCC 7305]ELS01028.1 hypothetical protein Xen7305DRAFT_00007290 [Xenococcus sp. PCC 7305]
MVKDFGSSSIYTKNSSTSSSLLSATKGTTINKLQQASVKLFCVLGLLTVNVFGQSLVARAAEVKNNNETASLDQIICLATSGNGYNWAATFTWASEMIRDAIAQAPPEARFNAACVSGASSGSAFVSVYGSLLNNKKLFARGDYSPQDMTRAEAQILSKSLLYMALAADFRPEVTRFYVSKDGDSQPVPPWWKSQFTLERVMLDFGTRVMLAQNISLTDINQVEQLEQFVQYQTVAELEAVAKNKEIRNQYRQVTFDIWEQSQEIINQLYQNANYPRTARKEDRDDFRDNPDHPVRQALAQQPPEGILAMTYGELAYTESQVDYQNMRSQAPPVDVLVPFVFTSEATAKKIIRSPFYRAQVTGQDPYVDQYVISVVPDYFTMIRHGVREPNLLPVGLYRVSPAIEGTDREFTAEISKFYQPLAEAQWQSEPSFKLFPSTRSLLQDGKLLNAQMGIAGGWIDSYVGGQATLYLGSGYANEKSNSNLYYSTFSGQDGMSNFAQQVVKKYFAPQDSKQAIAEIEAHREHLPVLINRYQEFHANHEISWQPIFVDWSVRFFSENKKLIGKIIGKVDNVLKLGFNYLPVANTKQSNYLLARTMNVVRQTLGLDEGQGYIFDRAYADRHYRQKVQQEAESD